MVLLSWRSAPLIEAHTLELKLARRRVSNHGVEDYGKCLCGVSARLKRTGRRFGSEAGER